MVLAKVKSVSDVQTAASGRKYKFVYFELALEKETINGEEVEVKVFYDRLPVDDDTAVEVGEWLKFTPK